MPESLASAPNSSDELYVGYLPVPRRQRRFLYQLVPIALLMVGALAAIWTYSQPDPGAGRWQDANITTLRGTAFSTPYPMLVSTDDHGHLQTTLLVGSGKHGIRERLAGLERREVVVMGTLLERNGPRMVEVLDAGAAIAAGTGTPTAAAADPDTGESVTLQGEIVDSKCFLGAMKPGHGKTHKACATLCVRGGIPPALVVVGEDNAVQFYVLADPDGAPVGDWITPFIADPVQVTGRVIYRGDLRILCVTPANVRPV